MKEHELQKSIIKYLKLKYPKLLYCASVGGVRTSMRQAIKMKETGYKKGMPDIFFYEPVAPYHGLAIEVKIKKGRPTKEQLWWRDQLNSRNYISEITYGFEETINVIERYLNGTISKLNNKKCKKKLKN